MFDQRGLVTISATGEVIHGEGHSDQDADPRPSIEERYASRADYLRQVEKTGDRLMRPRASSRVAR